MATQEAPAPAINGEIIINIQAPEMDATEELRKILEREARRGTFCSW